MKEKKTLDFVGSIMGNIVGIVFNNTVLLWNHLTGGIILDSWIDTLWAANLSMVLQILGNLILVFYRPARLYSFIQAIFSSLTLLSIIVFYLVFPIDFSQIAGPWANSAFRIILTISMATTIIGALVHLIKTIIGTKYKSKKEKKKFATK